MNNSEEVVYQLRMSELQRQYSVSVRDFGDDDVITPPVRESENDA
ncbi:MULTISPECIES: hypothetical protein [unclassified Pantoea]|nr:MULTISPECIES: hypothetical protein [unclassified Pantoea]GME41526.1 hypothetical protein ACJ1_27990 [Pantoea sp. QMID1]GME42602.1 hypothetical protein ACJ3_30750 [Pantoea sp. QMID3]GME56915.1 hypothetical protein ACJ4_24490 [Pantoea sp. QMID4]GME58933.1 hypothetical protein ACJ2_27160 [Pantoea sp. QMID2]